MISLNLGFIWDVRGWNYGVQWGEDSPMPEEGHGWGAVAACGPFVIALSFDQAKE